jgi:hypothetical protein
MGDSYHRKQPRDAVAFGKAAAVSAILAPTPTSVNQRCTDASVDAQMGDPEKI